MMTIPRLIGMTLLAIFVVYGTLWFLPKKEITYMPDDQLRAYALSHGLAPVPKTYHEMLKVTDNPENRLSPAKIALGKKLYFDTILSRDKTISCQNCHLLEEGGDDNLPTAIGFHGLANPKHLNSPTVLNAALAKRQFWDGRAKDVEEQAGGPMQAPFEMNITPDLAVNRVAAVPEYQEAFRKVFGGEGNESVTFANIRKAIGAYERTLLTRSAYDRFLEGDNNAIGAAAKRGLNLFIQKGCKGCHTGMSVGGQSLQQFPLRRALGDIFKTEPFPFLNTGGFLGKEGRRVFRVPILRNITKTAPYFHNGAVKELKEAIRIMSKYQIGEEFNKKQISDVEAFFKTLEGEIVPYNLNLTPGANLEKINLRGSDLSRRDLHEINLKNANLQNCDFFGTNLSGANLTGADVAGANFTSADLSFANLSFVDLSHTDLIETKLEGVNLEHALWRGGRVCGQGSFGKCL